MRWSDEAWEAARAVYESIEDLPFVKELAAGTLEMRKFRFYINQDRQYLDAYTRVLAHVASRMPEAEDMADFLRFATEGMAIEKSLHGRFSDGADSGRSPACAFYTAFLKSMCMAPAAVEAAAILPCFRVYQQVGEHILRTASLEGNPYADWIMTYAGEGFDRDTRRVTEICDRLADEAPEAVRRQMTQAYVDCTKLERMFWENAYAEEYF